LVEDVEEDVVAVETVKAEVAVDAVADVEKRKTEMSGSLLPSLVVW
jgi:hypothetical protein